MHQLFPCPHALDKRQNKKDYNPTILKRRETHTRCTKIYPGSLPELNFLTNERGRNTKQSTEILLTKGGTECLGAVFLKRELFKREPYKLGRNAPCLGSPQVAYAQNLRPRRPATTGMRIEDTIRKSHNPVRWQCSAPHEWKDFAYTHLPQMAEKPPFRDMDHTLEQLFLVKVLAWELSPNALGHPLH